ncbi:MAG: hypothetical protein RMK67_02755 [Chloroflexota bacterium]|nr:hypothetical protein [Chloroflexota bacterium]
MQVERRVEKENLGMAGEYAVASELCRRNLHAQVTLGKRKRTDILVYNPDTRKWLRVEVKTKQKREWPGITGINDDHTALVFVDYQNKGENERPDFYILTREDWHDFVTAHVLPRPGLAHLEQGYIPVWKDGYRGTGVRPDQIGDHREKWDKIVRLLQ